MLGTSLAVGFPVFLTQIPSKSGEKRTRPSHGGAAGGAGVWWCLEIVGNQATKAAPCINHHHMIIIKQGLLSSSRLGFLRS